MTKFTSSTESEGNELIATTGFKPNFLQFSMCLSKFLIPMVTFSKSGVLYCSFAAPPWCLSALMVATSTNALGLRPAETHLMFKNFSAPKSAPKPASVTTYSLNDIPILVAIIVLVPCAILANGPP